MTRVLFTLLCFSVAIFFFSCKSDTRTGDGSSELSETTETVSPNNSKALEGSGAEDISGTFVLSPTQIVQEGNVGFHFKSASAMRIYLDMPGEQNVAFVKNDVYAIISEKTVKETTFKVESIDLDAERPTIKIISQISKNTVPEYRPSFVVSVPKEKTATYPLIQLDGMEIPVFALN
jgi:hypothetical protein